MPLERISQGFKDISMTFQRHPLTSDIIALKNESAIARSVRNIIFTSPGEKFFNEDFGSSISNVLFNNINDSAVDPLLFKKEYFKRGSSITFFKLYSIFSKKHFVISN